MEFKKRLQKKALRPLGLSLYVKTRTNKVKQSEHYTHFKHNTTNASNWIITPAAANTKASTSLFFMSSAPFFQEELPIFYTNFKKISIHKSNKNIVKLSTFQNEVFSDL